MGGRLRWPFWFFSRPTIHVRCRLCSRSPNDLPTTLHDFLTLYPRLLFIPDHSWSFWTVQNYRGQSRTPRPSSPTSQDLPRPIPVLFFPSLRLHKTSPDHQGRERSAFRSAKCDRGFTQWGRDKMAAIFQTTFSNAFSWMQMYEFRPKFHWSLFSRVHLNNIPELIQMMAWNRRQAIIWTKDGLGF